MLNVKFYVYCFKHSIVIMYIVHCIILRRNCFVSFSYNSYLSCHHVSRLVWRCNHTPRLSSKRNMGMYMYLASLLSYQVSSTHLASYPRIIIYICFCNSSRKFWLDFIVSIRYHVKAQSVLEQYQHLPSFHGIQEDCDKIVGELKTVLKARLDDNEVGVSCATHPTYSHAFSCL